MPFEESKVEVCYVGIEEAQKRGETSKSKTGEKLLRIVRYAQVFLRLVRGPYGYSLIIVLSV